MTMGCRFSLCDCRRRSPMPRPSCPWCADTSTHRANFWSLVEDGLFPSEFFDTLRLGFFERNCQLYRCGSHLHWADQGRNFKQVSIYDVFTYYLNVCRHKKLHAQSQQKSSERPAAGLGYVCWPDKGQSSDSQFQNNHMSFSSFILKENKIQIWCRRAGPNYLEASEIRMP